MSSPSKKDLSQSVPLDELSAPLPSTADDQRLVAFSVRLPFATLLRLKQALHHLGTLEQDFVAEVLSQALDQLPESRLPLPAAKQAKLRKKGLARGR